MLLPWVKPNQKCVKKWHDIHCWEYFLTPLWASLFDDLYTWHSGINGRSIIHGKGQWLNNIIMFWLVYVITSQNQELHEVSNCFTKYEAYFTVKPSYSWNIFYIYIYIHIYCICQILSKVRHMGASESTKKTCTSL